MTSDLHLGQTSGILRPSSAAFGLQPSRPERMTDERVDYTTHAPVFQLSSRQSRFASSRPKVLRFQGND